jgi:hypothetical protein
MEPDRPQLVTREWLSNPEGHCELCASPAEVRVIRWTTPTPDEPERLVQQSHRFCRRHEPQAVQMEALLWETWHRRHPESRSAPPAER